MAAIAILGFGNVGSGVLEVLEENKQLLAKNAAEDIYIKTVFDGRNINGVYNCAFTKNINDILNDKEIEVVVECMGGENPALDYTKAALAAGKSVVTSNKELISKRGHELGELSAKNNINCLYEATVGGGIPIIRPICRSVTAESIVGVSGILNGTTNYILSKMTEGADYAEALSSAQAAGYAERDPSNDVDGVDAAYKLSILLSLITGKRVRHDSFPTEGIRNVTQSDIKEAKKRGNVIKLLAEAKIKDGAVRAKICPEEIPCTSPLAAVAGVFNGIIITGSATGNLMFYGQGAGRRPTASAVLADVIDAVRHKNRTVSKLWSEEEAQVLL